MQGAIKQTFMLQPVYPFLERWPYLRLAKEADIFAHILCPTNTAIQQLTMISQIFQSGGIQYIFFTKINTYNEEFDKRFEKMLTYKTICVSVITDYIRNYVDKRHVATNINPVALYHV